MKSSIYRRRSTTAKESAMFKKDNQQEHSFFGESSHEAFFKPANIIAPAQAVQRKCADCEKEDKQMHRAADKKEEEKLHRMGDKKEEEKIHKKETTALSTAGAANASAYIHSLNGKGKSLPNQTEQFFSARMGHDFSAVKIHTDKEAADSAKEVNAKAYTVGNDIVFSEGQYNAESAEGKKLMAHELVHVVQNNQDKIMKQPAQAASPSTITFNVTTQIQWALEALWIRPRREMVTWACIAAAPESDRPRQLMNYFISYHGNSAFDQIDRQQPAGLDRQVYLDNVFTYLWSLVEPQFMARIQARLQRDTRFRDRVNELSRHGGCGTVPFSQSGDMYGV